MDEQIMELKKQVECLQENLNTTNQKLVCYENLLRLIYLRDDINHKVSYLFSHGEDGAMDDVDEYLQIKIDCIESIM